jgi:serine/threonine-protein kinase SRPK3
MATYYITEDQESNLSSCLNANDEAGFSDIEEGTRSYSSGGLHPVQIGEVYGEKYRVIRKLGFGRESTVWLAADKLYVKLALGG